jgi:hypothetical protein
MPARPAQPQAFVRLPSGTAMALGAALLLPAVPSAVVGAGLTLLLDDLAARSRAGS